MIKVLYSEEQIKEHFENKKIKNKGTIERGSTIVVMYEEEK